MFLSNGRRGLELGVDEWLYVAQTVIDDYLQDDEEQDEFQGPGTVDVELAEFVNMAFTHAVENEAGGDKERPCQAGFHERCKIGEAEVLENPAKDGQCRGEVAGAEERPCQGDVGEGEGPGEAFHIPGVGDAFQPPLAEFVHHQS